MRLRCEAPFPLDVAVTLGEQRTIESGSAGPDAIRDRTDFAAALSAARERCGLTVRDAARACGIPSATLGGYFSGRHLPQMSQRDQFERLLRALEIPEPELPAWWDALLRVRSTAGAQTQRAPYRGLEGYDVADAELFVGREALVEEICRRVRDAAARHTPTVLTLVGVSGGGKSSLLRAGVMATLAEDGWDVVVTTPGQRPDAAYLRDEASASRIAHRPLLVAVDQFEEVFGPEVPAEQRAAFLDAIAEIVQPDESPVVVVIALRADFFASAMAEPALVDHLRDGQVFVGPMAPEDLRRVITEPAKRAGRVVEPALVELILRDLHDRRASTTHSSLPLLAHALVATWGRVGKGALRASDYVEAGGLGGAVQQTAEEVFASLSPDGQEQARKLFAQLVSVDDEGLATRRRISHAELGDEVAPRAVVEAFVDHRILTASQDTLEISHDIVLEAWPRLHQWIEDDRGLLRLRRRVSVSAAAWDRDGRDPSGLMQGPLLELVHDLPDSGLRLTASEQTFVDESIRAERERARARRRRRSLIATLAVVATVLAVLATTLSVYLAAAVGRSTKAESLAQGARRTALSREIALESTNLAATDPSLSAQLAVIAHRTAPTLDARSAVLDATGDPLVTRLVGPIGVLDAFPSPDGRTLATVASDGGIRFYDRSGAGAPRLVATLHVDAGNQMFAGAFSPVGHVFVAAGFKGDVTVVDVADASHPRVVTTLTGPKSSIQHLAFSPDGTVLYAAASDPALFRWSIAGSSYTALPTVTGFGGGVHAVAASSNGLVATGSADATVRLWRVSGTDLRLVDSVVVDPDPTDTVNTVTFSPDGTRLAAGANDEKVRVWSLGAGHGPSQGPVMHPVVTLGGFTSWVNGLDFSADGRLLAAAASGAKLAVWRTSDWQVVQALGGSANYTSVGFIPGSDQIVSGGLDGVARIRSVTGPRLSDFQDVIGASAQSADGSQLWVAPGSSNPVVAQVRRIGPLRYQETGLVLRAPVEAGSIDQVVAISPDGTELVAGTGTGHLVIWRLEAKDTGSDAQLLGVLTGSSALIEQVAFSPDGRWFGSVSDDGEVSIYPAGTTSLPTRAAKLDGAGMNLQLTFAPGSRLLAVASVDGVVHLWRRDGAAWAPLPALKGFSSYVYGVAFTPDGRTFAAAGADKMLRIYRVSPEGRFTLTQKVAGPQNTVTWLDFDRTGTVLAGSSQDKFIWIWHLEHGRVSTYARLGNLGSQPYTVQAIAGAREVMATGASGMVDGWSTDVGASIRAICASAGTPITPQEWHQFVPGEAYDPPCPAPR